MLLSPWALLIGPLVDEINRIHSKIASSDLLILMRSSVFLHRTTLLSHYLPPIRRRISRDQDKEARPNHRQLSQTEQDRALRLPNPLQP